VRAARALQLNVLQHVFTILKQHGRAAIVVPDNDSHLPSCSPFGLPVHVGRSRDLHCPRRRRRRRMPARERILKRRATNLHSPGRQTVRPRATQASRRSHLAAPADRHLDSFAPARSAFGLPVSFFAPSKFRSTPKEVRAGLALTPTAAEKP
jgi:hypothetical protein